MKLVEKKIKGKKVYECFFMKLYEDEVKLPNDKSSKRIYIKHDGASAVLPITKEEKIVLIKQYRYPVQEILLEVPAGKKDSPSEGGMECVVRELEEETGLRSSNIKKIQDFYSCVGYSNEKIELFIAYDCETVENPIHGDDDEFIEVVKYSKDEVKELVQSGQITDSKTLTLLLYYLQFS